MPLRVSSRRLGERKILPGRPLISRAAALRRYQVCLFCYGQVKDLCKNQCPGCRREYGAPVDAPVVRQAADDRAAAEASASDHFRGNGAGGGMHALASPNGLGTLRTGAAVPGANAAAAAAMGARQNAATASYQSQQQKRAVDAAHMKLREEVAAAGLPSRATWATASSAQITVPPQITRNPSVADLTENQQQQQQQLAPGGDESAWPSLGMAAAPPGPSLVRPQQQQQQRQDYGSGGFLDSHTDPHHRMLPSVSSTNLNDGGGSSSQDLVDQNVPHHLLDAFATAQVSV